MGKEVVYTEKNPIIRGRGVCDPHMRVFNDKVYLYASHDQSIENETFCMKDWQIWSSADFIKWELEETIHPEDTFMGESDACWAVDAIEKDGKYFYYFSNGNTQTGVAVSDEPGGPFKDALGKPLLDGTLTPTREYDPAVFRDDDGTYYLVFGAPAWCYGEGGYYIARLNEDMISLAEVPRKIELDHEADDKASLNKINGTYYLTFASYYAISDNVYGPYKMVGNTGASIDHGSYFEWNNQLFNAFTVCDTVEYFRASGICYVHVRKNKELVVDPLIVEYGVGQYDANWNRIEAEWYMKSRNLKKLENPRYGFDVSCKEEGALFFPNIRNLKRNMGISFLTACDCPAGAVIEVHRGEEAGELLGSYEVPCTKGLLWRNYKTVSGKISGLEEVSSMSFVLKLKGKGELRLDYFRLFPQE